MRITPATLIVSITLSLAACKKHDYCEKPPGNDKKCELTQVVETSSFKEDPHAYTRLWVSYDPMTEKASKVTVALFQLTIIDSINMRLSYVGNKAYFLREENPADTVMVATFGGGNRLVSMTEGNAPNERLVSTQFSYAAGKLSNIHFDFVGGFGLQPHYDSYGNVTSLEDLSGIGQNFFYTYDVNVKATQQFYSDEFIGDAYNTLYLAEFMRWLPDLEPKNKRLTSRVTVGEDTDLYYVDLTNHVYDNGKLISYQTNEFTTFTNAWSCNGKKDNTNNGHNGH